MKPWLRQPPFLKAPITGGHFVWLGKGAGTQKQGIRFFRDQLVLEREPEAKEGQSEQRKKDGL